MTGVEAFIVCGGFLYLVFRWNAKAIPHVPPQLPWKSAVDEMIMNWRRL